MTSSDTATTETTRNDPSVSLITQLAPFVTWLSIAAGALSIVLLLKQALDELSFVAPLQTMLDYYKGWLSYLFGWAHEPLAELAELARHYVPADWQPRVRPGVEHHIVMAALTTSMTMRVLRFYPRDLFGFSVLLFIFFTQLVSFTIAFGEFNPDNPKLLTRTIQSVTGLEYGAELTSIMDLVLYFCYCAVCVVVQLLTIFFLMSSNERARIPRSAWFWYSRYLLALAFGPLLGAICFIATNAGLKFVGVG